jgi:hypothetical protein
MFGGEAMIVNITPFRGPSADVGPTYEMGFRLRPAGNLCLLQRWSPFLRSRRHLLWRCNGNMGRPRTAAAARLRASGSRLSGNTGISEHRR